MPGHESPSKPGRFRTGVPEPRPLRVHGPVSETGPLAPRHAPDGSGEIPAARLLTSTPVATSSSARKPLNTEVTAFLGEPKHPAPSTQHPAPSTQHPAPSTQRQASESKNLSLLGDTMQPLSATTISNALGSHVRRRLLAAWRSRRRPEGPHGRAKTHRAITEAGAGASSANAASSPTAAVTDTRTNPQTSPTGINPSDAMLLMRSPSNKPEDHADQADGGEHCERPAMPGELRKEARRSRRTRPTPVSRERELAQRPLTGCPEIDGRLGVRPHLAVHPSTKHGTTTAYGHGAPTGGDRGKTGCGG